MLVEDDDGHSVLEELLLFDKLDFDDLKIHQLDAHIRNTTT